MRFHTEVDDGRQFAFMSKAAIYSAGTTFMSFFARDNRHLTRGTQPMVHERQNHCTIRLEGPLTSTVAVLKAKLHEMETSIAIQNEGFAYLVRDTAVTYGEVVKRALANWYIEAEDAVKLGIVRATI